MLECSLCGGSGWLAVDELRVEACTQCNDPVRKRLPRWPPRVVVWKPQENRVAGEFYQGGLDKG